MTGEVHSAAQVAQEAYAIWRGSCLQMQVLPPHWDELDHVQRGLLTFIVLHTARTAIAKEFD